VGVRVALTLAFCALAAAPAAFAQNSTEDGSRDCERLAAVKLKRDNPAFRRFAIMRADVEEDKFADKVGSQYVSTVYHGRGVYQESGPPQTTRFICLHGGAGKGAVFIYALPQ
jgi:hypothetical protein